MTTDRGVPYEHVSLFGRSFDALSMAEQISLLDDEDQDEILEDLSEDDLVSYKFWGRPSQIEGIESSAWVTIIMAGRGYGKTFTGAHWVIKKAMTPGTRIALIGRTVPDVRDVMVRGTSGILELSPDSFRPEYIPSVRRLIWPNGSIATTFSATEPDQLRGPQHHYAWADELAAFKDKPDASGLTTWDQVLISTRLGAKPQILGTTTPKRTETVRNIIRQANDEPHRVRIVTGSTMDNRSNLATDYIQQMLSLYEGTALERQELYGEMLGIVEGALWRESDFRKVPYEPGEGKLAGLQTVISVDPGVTAGGDATGIVVVTSTMENDLDKRRVWVREDLTISDEPEVWALAIAEAWRRWQPKEKGELPPVVVAEQNQGGAMIRAVIQQHDPGIPVALVPAIKSKADRARAVVMAYRQGRVMHDETFEDLQDELTSWEPDSKWSPNRMDALVHGLRAVLIDPRPLYKIGSIGVGHGPSGVIKTVIPDWRRGRGSLGMRAAPWRERVRR